MATKFVNQVYFDIPYTNDHKVSNVVEMPNIDHSVKHFGQLVSPAERQDMLYELENSNWLPVGINGMSADWSPGDYIGSYRASNYTQEYANVLWDRIKDFLPKVRSFDDNDSTDWDGHELWEPIGVSPLLRFIRYTDGGFLIAHYDAPYVENEDTRTLSSLVIYLEHDDTLTGGATRYLEDPQGNIPVAQRDLSDKTADDHFDVKFSYSPDNGDGIIFDHRLLHDSEKVEGEGRKTIIRTDIMYRKVS